jgi:hypothetical protein
MRRAAMIGTPELLPETQASASDALSDLLEGMRLSGVVLFRAEFREPWSVTTPDCRRLDGLLPFRTEHMIPFHVVASGGCWIETPESEPVWLKEGEVSGAGESHPRALAEPDVTLSRHTAPIVRPRPKSKAQ